MLKGSSNSTRDEIEKKMEFMEKLTKNKQFQKPKIKLEKVEKLKGSIKSFRVKLKRKIKD